MPNQKTRFIIFAALTGVFILLILLRYVEIMIISPSVQPVYSPQKNVIERGLILDRNGRILAIQTRLNSVTAWMPSIKDKKKTARILAEGLGLNASDILENFNKRSGFLYIKRKITPTESKSIEKMINDGDLPGITLEPEYGRNYPERQLTAHLTGFTGIDNIGLDGIELMYNDILSPQPDADQETTYGNQIFLTIDLNIQYMAEKLAREAYKKYNADDVMILMMDAKTGEFLAYTSIPEFDPNTFTTASESDKENRPVTYAYEPGSVFKIFSLASMMEIGGITRNSHFYCNGKYEKQFPDETVVINCLGIHGDVTPQTIIQYSCNSGAAYASETVSILDFYLKLSDFGFGSRTGLPLPGETIGILKKPENWSGRTKPTIAIGQEISVSAVQMITAATAISNGGTLLKPHIIKKIVSPEGKLIREVVRTPVRNVIGSSVAQAILEDMETATRPTGTARRLQIEGLRISAKTGTAQRIDPETGKYSKNAFVASTMAILPTNDPRVIIYAVIDNPKGPEFYGGRIVTPMVKELVEEIVPILGIRKTTDKVIEHPGKVRIALPRHIEPGSSLPDLTGLSKREILPLFSIKGISVEMEGEGWVVSQTPSPGTALKEGTVVKLKLK